MVSVKPKNKSNIEKLTKTLFMKTPIQELIDQFKEYRKMNQSVANSTYDYSVEERMQAEYDISVLDLHIKRLYKKLPKEKEQLTEAYKEGTRRYWVQPEEWFDKTYTTE